MNYILITVAILHPINLIQTASHALRCDHHHMPEGAESRRVTAEGNHFQPKIIARQTSEFRWH